MRSSLILGVYHLLVCSLFHTAHSKPPPSPCPDIFAYEGEFDRDRWYGVISFTSNIELAGINIKIQLDQPCDLLVAWDGEVRSVDNTFFHVFNPYLFQSAHETLKFRVMVKYNPNIKNPPSIRNIVVDGTTVCQSGQSLLPSKDTFLSTETESRPSKPYERFDPTFNNNQPDLTAEHSNRGTQTGGNSGSGNFDNYDRNKESNTNSGSYDRGTQVDSSSTVDQYDRDRVSGQGGSSASGVGASSQYDRGTQTYNGGSENYPNRPASSSTNDRGTLWPATNNNNNNNNNPTDWSNSGGGDQNRGPEANQLSTKAGGYNRPSTSSNNNNDNNYAYNNNQRPQLSSSNRYPSDQPLQQPSGGVYNSNPVVSNGGPLVATLTIPNSFNDGSNINQIVELINNQLKNQNSGSFGNNTYIVAVVNPSLSSPVNRPSSSASVPIPQQQPNSYGKQSKPTAQTYRDVETQNSSGNPENQQSSSASSSATAVHHSQQSVSSSSNAHSGAALGTRQSASPSSGLKKANVTATTTPRLLHDQSYL